MRIIEAFQFGPKSRAFRLRRRAGLRQTNAGQESDRKQDEQTLQSSVIVSHSAARPILSAERSPATTRKKLR